MARRASAMGVFYTLTILATLVLFKNWLFYLLYSLTEMVLTLLVVWNAWKWLSRVVP